jgi:hypothetical protein
MGFLKGVIRDPPFLGKKLAGSSDNGNRQILILALLMMAVTKFTTSVTLQLLKKPIPRTGMAADRPNSYY